MPILTAIIGGLFAEMFSFFVKFATRKIATALTFGTLMSALYAGLLLCFKQVISPFVSLTFRTAYGQALGLAFPPIAGTCLVAVAASWACCAAFSWNREQLRMYSHIV